MKKMKKVVSLEASPYAVYEDARTRLKHQSLMQDYEELEKETDAMKNRLKIMEQKKQTLLAEVKFLRRRYKYLTEKQPTHHLMKRDHSQLRNYENRSASITKSKNRSKKESASRCPSIPFDLNQKERAYNGMEAPFRKPAPFFDLNQKVRILSAKEAVRLPNPRPAFDLNQQERFHSGIEAAKRKITPSFDLNQVSGEEEELQANNCEPLKGLLRNANTEEQHKDMKLLVCRNIGNGSNRAGKRKITWQDQVALRV